MPRRSESGAASVEYVALAVLVALIVLGAIAGVIAGPPSSDGRELGVAIARKIRCSAALPGPCWRDPLTAAYGREVAGVVRALAPDPRAVSGPAGVPLVPVDFRYCRSGSCAVPGPQPAHLTASGRRVTAFSSIDDVSGSAGAIQITYWLYRPTIGWDRIVRGASAERVRALGSTPLLDSADPRLVPLETLAGRDYYQFPPGEEPPWRWRIHSRIPS